MHPFGGFRLSHGHKISDALRGCHLLGSDECLHGSDEDPVHVGVNREFIPGAHETRISPARPDGFLDQEAPLDGGQGSLLLDVCPAHAALELFFDAEDQDRGEKVFGICEVLGFSVLGMSTSLTGESPERRE